MQRVLSNIQFSEADLLPVCTYYIHFIIEKKIYWKISQEKYACLLVAIFNTLYSIFNNLYSIFNILYSIFNTLYSMFNGTCPVPDGWYRYLVHTSMEPVPTAVNPVPDHVLFATRWLPFSPPPIIFER